MVKRKAENTKRFINRFIATVLVFVLLLQTFAWIGSFNIFAAPVHSEVTTTETVSQNGVSITTRKKLSYLGGNTFQLDITATSSIKEAFETSKRTASEDGVFIVPERAALAGFTGVLAVGLAWLALLASGGENAFIYFQF